MRVLFLGTPETAVPSLDALLGAGHEVPLVVTRPDRPVGRSKAPVSPAVKARASAAGLAVLQPDKLRDREFLEAIMAARADVLAVVAYGRILPKAVLDAAPLGAVNVHFSLLPSYRGAAPVAWALARGETETGVTTFLLDEGLDTGDVLMTRKVSIEAGEHAPALLDRLARVGSSLLVDTLAALQSGCVVPRAQDHALASVAPLLRRGDGSWDPAWTARQVEGRVRGFDPWPGVWAARNGRRIRIVDARSLDGEATGEPSGTLLDLPGDLVRVAAGDGTVVEVFAVQPEGRRTMSAREAVSGRQLRPGECLERPPA